MNRGSRSRAISVALLAALSAGAVAPLGCNREKAEADKLVADAASAHEQLKPKLEALRRSFSAVHAGLEDLATAVPEGPELRARVLSADEVLGVIDAKLKWLAGELDAAKAAGKKAEAARVKDEVGKTAAEMTQMGSLIAELAHEKARLQRIAVLLKAPYERVLSTGYRVKGATDGVESRLIGFLEDPRRKIDETTWFTFDRLSFVQNGSELDLQGSRSQLDNVAQILGAYPAAKLVIGGYTDNAGPAAAGKKRSQQQAQAVKQALVQTGVAAPRLGAEGFGAANPLCAANDSEACKAQNRRIAARVTAK